MSKCHICDADNPDGLTACLACGSPLSLEAITMKGITLAAGTALFNGRYTVGQVLGQGGFGITYLGSDLIDQVAVAIKEFFLQGCLRHGTTVRPTGSIPSQSFEAVKEKFLEEGRTLYKFRHPGIVSVKSVFEENNTAYMAMEYLKGWTLQKMLDQRGALPEKEAVGYVIRVAEALGEIHKANILHRDIKPENIIITEDGRVVLIDFGSAREFAAGQTRTMTSWLTPGYAPIEQYGKKGQFNPTTDVYALGATAYHLIAGQLPEQATDRIIQDNLVPLNKVNPRISSRTSDAVIWAMQLDASRRPQSMSDFISALGGNGSAAIAGRPAPTVMVSPGEYESRRKSRKAVWVPVLLIALAVLIIVSLICMNYVTLPFWKSATQTTYQVSPPPSLDQENITSLPQTTPIAWLNGDTSRYNYDLTPSTCKVTVSGPRNIVDNIAWDEVVVGVDLAGLSAGTYDLAVSVSSGLPGNIDISFNPAIVSVAISELSAPAPRRQRGHSGGGSSGGDTGGDEGGDDNGGNGRGPITQP